MISWILIYSFPDYLNSWNHDSKKSSFHENLKSWKPEKKNTWIHEIGLTMGTCSLNNKGEKQKTFNEQPIGDHSIHRFCLNTKSILKSSIFCQGRRWTMANSNISIHKQPKQNKYSHIPYFATRYSNRHLPA